MKISLICAMSENRAIGLNNALPWNPIKADWDNLKTVTAGKIMIMGRKSYDNPHRIWSETGNFVITHQSEYKVEDNFEVVNSLEAALEKCKNEEEVFILGGEEVFRLALPLADKIYLTIVHEYFEGDTFFPEFNENDFRIIAHRHINKGNDTDYNISLITYQRK